MSVDHMIRIVFSIVDVQLRDDDTRTNRCLGPHQSDGTRQSLGWCFVLVYHAHVLFVHEMIFL